MGTPQHGQSELTAGQGSCSSYAVLGSICRYTCDEGYHLSGGEDEVLLECLAHTGASTLGYWDQEPTECEREYYLEY